MDFRGTNDAYNEIGNGNYFQKDWIDTVVLFRIRKEKISDVESMKFPESKAENFWHLFKLGLLDEWMGHSWNGMECNNIKILSYIFQTLIPHWPSQTLDFQPPPSKKDGLQLLEKGIAFLLMEKCVSSLCVWVE